jgi:DNA repair protein RadC
MELIREINDKIRVRSARDIYSYFKEFETEDREYFITVGLNTKNEVLYREIVTIGTLDASIVHPREAFKKAIMCSAKSIIIAHNHPSGDTTPSRDDEEVTRNIKKAGEILNIPLLDHIIIGEKYYSFAEHDEI